MHALQLLGMAKVRNIRTDQELSDQLRLVGTDENESAAGSSNRRELQEGDVRIAIREKRLHSQHREGRISPRHHPTQHETASPPGGQAMHSLRITEQFKGLFSLAVQMTGTAGADAIILLLDGPADWLRLKAMAGKSKVIVAADTAEQLEGAKEAGLATVRLDMPDSPTYERLTPSGLEAGRESGVEGKRGDLG